jgi:calcineurin-like phosphoesterase family protein
MDATIIERMIAPLKSSDDFYFLGDMGSNESSIKRFFDSLPKGVKFYWILGNHDQPKTVDKFRNHCHYVGHMCDTKIVIGEPMRGKPRQHIVMAHYPMITWDRSHYNSWQLFGHHHAASWKHDEIPWRANGKQLNVNCEFFGYEAVNEIYLAEIMATKPNNWDLIPK